MYLFSLAIFIVVMGYLVFFNKHNRLIKKGHWMTLGFMGVFAISYYYGASYYAWHYGKIRHDCAVVTNNTLKERGRAQRTKPILNVTNEHNTYSFVYHSDLFSDKFSFVGLKSGDNVCFDYVEPLPLSMGYPNLLKFLTIQSS